MRQKKTEKAEVRFSFGVSPVVLLAVVARVLALQSESAACERTITGSLCLHLDRGQTERLADAVRQGQLPGVEIDPTPPERRTNLVLTRRPGDAVAVGDDVTVSIDEVNRQAVRVRITAPESVRVLRSELLLREAA
jgi:carbon storage regulator CsrA